MQVREGVKQKNGPVRNVLSPPPRKAKTVFLWIFEKNICFFIIFRYTYQKMQNGIKRMFFYERENFGSKGKILMYSFFVYHLPTVLYCTLLNF